MHRIGDHLPIVICLISQNFQTAWSAPPTTFKERVSEAASYTAEPSEMSPPLT